MKYKTNITLSKGKFDYHTPDVQKISGAKYKWINENEGVCAFEYPDLINNENVSSITEKEYDDFAKVILSSDKDKINSDGIDTATVIAKFTEGGGIATFVINAPNEERKIVDVIIDADGVATLDGIFSNTKGIITISIKSKKWHSVFGLGSVQIESI